MFAPWCRDAAGEKGVKFEIGERGVFTAQEEKAVEGGKDVNED